MSKTAYQQLMTKYQDISVLYSVQGVLSWDIETKKMPSMGLENRSLQFSTLTKLIHEFWSSSTTQKLLDKIDPHKLDDNIQRRNIELIKRKSEVNSKLPMELVTKLASQANKTNEIWKKAKAKTDFSIVKDEMENLINLYKEQAQKLAEIKQMDHPFDAAIDERDEGMTSKKINDYFSEARDFLVPFIKTQTAKFEDMELLATKINLTREEQVIMAHEIAKLFQYPTPYENPEIARGSIDEIEHPQTIGCGPDDIRVTVKFGNYLRVIGAMNHEIGHALHGLHKNQAWNYTPVNNFGYPSLGECTSRYTENKIGGAYEYYVHMFPIFNDLAGFKFNNIDIDTFYRNIMKITPGTSRMNADEVTYGLHIIIRFEIEKAIFDDQISISELPQIWNQKYEEYLGVEVPNDTLGIMQDLHWYSRWYAYFHGYFMGDLMGSQFHAFMENDLPNWKMDLASGDLSKVIAWHTANIYSQGGMYPSLSLVKKVTGEELNVNYFKNYLKSKYSDI